jgi:hypothetical protein
MWLNFRSSRRFWLFFGALLGIAWAGIAYYRWANSFTVELKNESSYPITVSSLVLGGRVIVKGATVKPRFSNGQRQLNSVFLDAVNSADAISVQLVVVSDRKGKESLSCELRKNGNPWCRFEIHYVAEGLVCFKCEPLL